MGFPPMAHLIQERPQRFSERSDCVRYARRGVGINGTFDDSSGLQLAKMMRQRTLGHAGNIAFNLREALGSVEELFENCSFPATADDARGGFHRAKLRLLLHLLLSSKLYTTCDFVSRYLDITADRKDTSIRHASGEASRKNQPG